MAESATLSYVSPDALKTFLSVGQVAELFEVSPRTVRDWAENGHLPSLRVGDRGHRRFRREDVEKLLADQGSAA